MPEQPGVNVFKLFFFVTDGQGVRVKQCR